jgi:hypothetical protein
VVEPISVEKLVDEFKALRLDNWQTYHKAKDECCCASLDFAAFCARHGVVAEMLELSNFKFQPSYKHVAWIHYVVWLPTLGRMVDWTWLQYREDGPYPLIQTREELAQNWSTIQWDYRCRIDENRKGGLYGA